MKCPKCQFENPDEMKFCGECGSKLESICPNCSFLNPPNSKFCGECGFYLRKPKETPAVDDLDKKAPPFEGALREIPTAPEAVE